MSMPIYVIKIGGEIINNTGMLRHFCNEILNLKKSGIHIILVHGGGQQATELGEKIGHSPTIIHGRRVTDETTLDIVKMVFAGKINTEIVSMLQCTGVSSIGISGIDSNLIQAKRRPPQKIDQQIIDFGFVGDIIKINPELLFVLLKNNFIPVIAPLASDENGVIYNINADTVASSITLAVKSEKWIIMSQVGGVYDKNKNIIPTLTCAEARALIHNKIITAGMLPKIEAIISAIQKGVPSIEITNGINIPGTIFYEK